MVEFGFADLLSIVQTSAIVVTLGLTFYFSKRQIQSLSIDVETRVLNDLDEKLHRMGEVLIERPQMLKVIYNIPANWNEDVVFSYYILFMCAHAFHMRERKVLSDNEWAGWLQWIKNTFRHGTITQDWKDREIGSWFDPSFRNFIDNEIIPSVRGK
jgi:hypothetical protein